MDAEKRDLIERLGKDDDKLREAFAAHKQYESVLCKMEKKKVLTTTDEMEKKELKIKKLSKKDEIEKILAGYSQAGAN